MGRGNFMEKMQKIFLSTLLKIPPENSLPRNSHKTEMTSRNYDVNDHVYSKLKSIYLCTDLANIKIIWNLTLSLTNLYGYWLELLNNHEVKQLDFDLE